MSLTEIYSSNKINLSYEIFPPKDDINGEKLLKLYDELEILKKYKPELVSVTYGAGGSNRSLSFEILSHLKDKLALNVMPHFTCVCSKKDDIESYLNDVENLNIENILALRGDEPIDINVCYSDFKYAKDLVDFIKQKSSLSIAVAGYPEGHIDSPDLDTDIRHLKQKIQAGGEVIFTQMCFDNDKYYRYFEKVRALDINVPIAFGVLPILSYKQFLKMMEMAKVCVPKKLLDSIDKYKNNSDDIKKVGIDYSTEQCIDLMSSGMIAGLHFYTLNKSHSTSKILDNLEF